MKVLLCRCKAQKTPLSLNAYQLLTGLSLLQTHLKNAPQTLQQHELRFLGVSSPELTEEAQRRGALTALPSASLT